VGRDEELFRILGCFGGKVWLKGGEAGNVSFWDEEIRL